MKKRLSIFFIILAFITSTINAQSRHYDVILFGNVIGEINTQINKTSEKTYELSYTSKAEAEVFFTHTKTFVQAKILFKDGFLNTGHVVRKKNDEFQEIECQWENNQYQIIENEKKSINTEKIYYCTTNFFFQEPKYIEQVYVERLLKFVPIEHLGNNQYLTKVDGGTNLYTYKNGVLQSLKSKKGISIFMELSE